MISNKSRNETSIFSEKKKKKDFFRLSDLQKNQIKL